MGSLGDGGSGVIYVQGQGHQNIDVNILNTTITNNINNGTGDNYKGSLLFYRHPQATGSKNMALNNCIIWDNEGDIHSIIKNTAGIDFNSLAVNNTLLEHPIAANLLNVAKTNIIIGSPMFTDSTNNVFTLKAGSPAIDAGTQSGLNLSTKDLGGTERVLGSEIDLGCYEYNPTASVKNRTYNSISIYPNPTTGLLNIQNQQPINQVTVTDITGKVLIDIKTQKSILDVSQLPTGVYILKVIENGTLATARFIKQ